MTPGRIIICLGRIPEMTEFCRIFMGCALDSNRQAHRFALSNACKDLRCLEGMANAATVTATMATAAKKQLCGGDGTGRRRATGLFAAPDGFCVKGEWLSQPPAGGVDPHGDGPPDPFPDCPGDSRRGQRPRPWIDATCMKVRQNNRIVSVAAITAVGVNSDGRREVLGLDIAASEAEPFWAELSHAN